MEQRYYYKDKSGNLYNFKTPHFMIDKEVEKQETIINENGEEEIITYTVTERVLDDNYEAITEEEFNELSKPIEPTEEQKAYTEKQQLIATKQARLEIVKWKIEQVDLFHEEREDIDELREEARQLHSELEELKK